MSVEPLETHLRKYPQDWSSWLVYGDWLLEQGDVRGELILLEHLKATGARTARGRPDTQRAIDALISKHESTWRAVLPAGVDVVTWRNGFIAGVQLAWTEDAPRNTASRDRRDPRHSSTSELPLSNGSRA